MKYINRFLFQVLITVFLLMMLFGLLSKCTSKSEITSFLVGTEKMVPNEQKPTFTWAFVDKSNSLQLDSLDQEKYKAKFRATIQKYLGGDSSKVYISYIYGNTQSQHNVVQYTLNLPKKRKYDGLTEREEKQEAKTHKWAVKRRKNMFIDAIIKRSFSVPCNQRATSILTTLPMIGKEIKNVQEKVTILFFSDMLEQSSMRNLDLANNHNQVLTFAEKDFSHLRIKRDDIQKPETILSKVSKIEVILPPKILDQAKSSGFIPTYWQNIFAKAGYNGKDILWN